jgi:hypothetical protein
MGNINNFNNVKPGTLALVENGIGGANAILVYLINQQEVRGFTISAEGVIGCARAVPHENIIKAFGITCVDGWRIRELLIELFTGSRTACQNLYKIYERSPKIVDMTIAEVSEVVSRQRGETVKVNIVEQCKESTNDEEPTESVYEDQRNTVKVDNDTETTEDNANGQNTHTYNYEEATDDTIEPAIGDIVVYDGVAALVEESDGGCDGCFLSSRMCGRILCAASLRKDGKQVRLCKVVGTDADDDKGTTEKREWELSEHSYDSIEPAIGDVVTVYGVRCTVAEGAGSCHKCAARANGCAFMDCTASDRQDSKYVYLKKIEDGVVTESSDDGNSEWSISEQDDDFVEPKLGTTGYVNGVKAVVADVAELHGDNPCEHCVAWDNGCLKIVCTGPDRGDNTRIYLRKAED